MITIKVPNTITILAATNQRLASEFQASAVNITAENEFQFTTSMPLDEAATYVNKIFANHNIDMDADTQTFTITPFDPSWN